MGRQRQITEHRFQFQSTPRPQQQPQILPMVDPNQRLAFNPQSDPFPINYGIPGQRKEDRDPGGGSANPQPRKKTPTCIIL